ncbi:ATP-binding cassette subfamily F protein 3 [Hypnocyclicus thermotrophus]|uniref:ATP-binding cassette subfamily F protein 3 n=1 Tax=Hypnocyclicus thermotrophus TaxID=1627895 RepID=A0AA46I5H8_9FUSO|nr:ABC-F family ATP-binding cassette domain-containing protein [Hypnocyclicus thermotrophus]TDT69781.1 ATP-binding cassette subfamily F protein 3 [Hypnocyclicus thermotrophus]
MALLTVNNLNKQFLGTYIFCDVSFSIDEKDKIGFIGVNGAGKSTLVKILLDKESHDISEKTKEFGTINKKRNLKIGYLSQHFELNEENTIFDELMSVFDYLKEDYKKIQKLNKKLSVDIEKFDEIMEELSRLSTKYEQEEGYAIEYKVKQILNGLNFEENQYNLCIENLSGGQKSRVALGKILLQEPDLLILDEPTNHLDINAIEWLEKFLQSYNRAFILISHDRYFLDNVVNKIYELENKKINIYNGNFSDYIIQKEAYLSGAVKSFEKEQEKLKKMEEFVRRYKAGVKAKQARGRQKLLDRMEKMENPVINIRKMRLKFESARLSTDKIFKIKRLKKEFNDKLLFQNLDLDIYRGDRIGIIGKNGVGKSTLLRILVEKDTFTSGTIERGEKLDIAYYDQEHANLSFDYRVLDELMYSFSLSEEEARRIAGGFLFDEEKIEKKIAKLSGGERARVSFMKLILQKPNVLILDEPTNHLDIYSREVLEEALEDYDGTIIVVSHDRYFLENTVNKIYEVHENGATYFNGNYDSYKEFKKNNVENEKEKNNDYEEQKRIKNRINSLEKKFEQIEKELEELELKKDKIQEKFDEAGKINDVSKLLDYQEKLDKLEEEILEKMTQWEEIELELNELKG